MPAGFQDSWLWFQVPARVSDDDLHPMQVAVATEECSSAQAEAAAAGERVAELEGALRVSLDSLDVPVKRLALLMLSKRMGRPLT